MYIASASTSVKFHEFPGGNVVYNYQPGSTVDGPIRSISWSKDGNWLTLVPHSGLTEIISVRDQLKLMYTIHDIEEPSCASFQKTTKRYVALGTKSGQIVLYDIKSRCIKKKFPETKSSITHINFTPKDTHIIASTSNGDVVLFNHTAGNMVSSFRVPKSESVSVLQVNATKRNLVLCGSNEGIVALWDTFINKAVFFADAHKAPVTSVTFSPIHSDLILTTGLDRQFCFYDTVSKECIANVAVDNNIHSADFSPDGINFVLGSQNGKMLVYDSRRIQEPVHTLEAHTSTIKHLAFQKTGDNESSFMNPSSEFVPKEIENHESEQNADSFGLVVDGSVNGIVPEEGPQSTACPEAGDSFMAAIGLDGSPMEPSRQEKSLGITEGVKKWMHSKVSLNETPFISNTTSRQPKLLQDKISLCSSKIRQASSTPKYLAEELNPVISPIPCSSDIANQNVNLNGFTNVVKDAVRAEMSNFFDNVKNDIDYQLKSGVSQMRRLCLDMQMSMVKEFIKIENSFNGLREELIGEYGNDRELMEENLRLRNRVAELEGLLANRNGNGAS